MLGFIFSFLGVLLVNTLWIKISVGVSIFNHLLGGLTMQETQLKQLPKGEFFKLSPSESAPVWVRDYYERSERKFWVYKFDDINAGKFVSGSKAVFSGFTF